MTYCGYGIRDTKMAQSEKFGSQWSQIKTCTGKYQDCSRTPQDGRRRGGAGASEERNAR